MASLGAARPIDVAIIGGGIVGCATAMALCRKGLSVEVLEAEPRVAFHQTGHNSGVIHSGLYYRPGSLKATLCAEGRQALYDFCARHGIPHRRSGKLVVATSPEEVARLDALEARGRANGLEGLRRVSLREMREIEPAVGGSAGLFVPETGVVDFAQVTHAYAREIQEAGGSVRTHARVLGVRVFDSGLALITSSGDRFARFAVNCAGLQSDRVARLFGVEPEMRIVPFLGQYWDLRPGSRSLVRGLIYPVPDPRFPFLGIHFTRGVHDEVHAGPNAVLALHREGYRPFSFLLRDTADTLLWPGFWRMALRFWSVGLGEIARSLSRHLVLRAMRRLVPAIEPGDLVPAVPGIRAQALGRDGTLLDDFVIVEGPRSIHVLNAPSPAATASIAIGRHVAERAARSFGFGGP